MMTVKTCPTLESYKKYWWSKPRSVIYLVNAIVLTAFELIQLAAAGIGFLLTGKGLLYIFVTVLLIAVGGGLIFYAFYMPKKLFNMSQKLCSDVTETITFGEDSFIAENVGSRINERVENMYSSITSAKFSNGWFVIICDKFRFYAFTANEFTEGSAYELCGLLSSKAGNKFKSNANG